MSEQLRWGILSTANIGRKKVIPAIQASSNGVAHAVASRELERARAFADELNIPNAYGTYDELINDPEVDAIYIPTPNSEHAEWSIKCAKAGKPTLCEKPLASNSEEAQRMVDTFAEKGVLFAEAFMYRFHPQTVTVKQMIEDGAIGDLKTMSATFTFSINDPENVRLSKDLAGGALMDVGCYCINVMRHMTDAEPYRVQALADMGEQSGVDEALTGVLAFSDGVMGHFDCSLRAHRTHTYDLRGTTGRIRVDEGFVMADTAETVIHYWQDNDYEQITISPADSYQIMVEDFADALRNNRPPRFHPQDGVDNMRVIDRLVTSFYL